MPVAFDSDDDLLPNPGFIDDESMTEQLDLDAYTIGVTVKQQNATGEGGAGIAADDAVQRLLGRWNYQDFHDETCCYEIAQEGDTLKFTQDDIEGVLTPLEIEEPPTFTMGQTVQCKDRGDLMWYNGIIDNLKPLECLTEEYTSSFKFDVIKDIESGKIWDVDVEPGWFEAKLIKKSGEVAGSIKIKPVDGEIKSFFKDATMETYKDPITATPEVSLVGHWHYFSNQKKSSYDIVEEDGKLFFKQAPNEGELIKEEMGSYWVATMGPGSIRIKVVDGEARSNFKATGKEHWGSEITSECGEEFEKGQEVQMRDTDKEEWKAGEVTGTNASGDVLVVEAGWDSDGFTWKQIKNPVTGFVKIKKARNRSYQPYIYKPPPIEPGPHVDRSMDMDESTHDDLRRQVGGDPYTTAKKDIQAGCTGLSNPMFWCFFNAATQCLSHTPGLARAIMAIKDIDEAATPVLAEFAKLMDELWSGEYDNIKASGLFAAVHNREVSDGYVAYTDTKQQDSIGLMERLLDMLKDDLKAHGAPDIFEETFGYSVKKTKVCSSCDHIEAEVKSKNQYIFHASMNKDAKPVNNREDSVAVAAAREKDQEAVSLNTMLDGYFVEENYEGYKCDKCGEVGTTIFRERIMEPPKCMIVALKRFKYNPVTDGFDKDCSRVIVEKDIDLSPYLAEGNNVPQGSAHFEVYGMQRHIGSTLGGGHYTARIRTLTPPEVPGPEAEAECKGEEEEHAEPRSAWRDFDDSWVESIKNRKRTDDDLHKTDDKRWETSPVFASHLIYSVLLMRKEVGEVDVDEDEEALMRTKSCYFEAKPKPFKWNKTTFSGGGLIGPMNKWNMNSTSGTSAGSALGTSLGSSNNVYNPGGGTTTAGGTTFSHSVGAGYPADTSGYMEMQPSAIDYSMVGLGVGFEEGYCWTQEGIHNIPSDVQHFMEIPSAGEPFTAQHHSLAESLGAEGGMADFVSRGLVSKIGGNPPTSPTGAGAGDFMNDFSDLNL